MKLAGLQKTTLLDFPQHVACTVFTSGCNLRCPFCHNASLISGNANELSEQEFFSFLNLRKNMLDGVCITGGEPLIQPDIVEFIDKIRQTDLRVKLDTNGTNPLLLKQLVDSKRVDYVAMDIKNSPNEYRKTTGIADIDIEAISKSVEILLESKMPYEFRTTVVRQLHTEENLREIAEWIKGAKKYVLQKYQPSDDVLCGNNLDAYSDGQMERFCRVLSHYLPCVELRGI